MDLYLFFHFPVMLALLGTMVRVMMTRHGEHDRQIVELQTHLAIVQERQRQHQHIVELQRSLDAPLRKVAESSQLQKRHLERQSSPNSVMCRHCGKGHNTKQCWKLYPDRRPKWMQKKGKAIARPNTNQSVAPLGQRAPVDHPDIIVRHVISSRQCIPMIARGQLVILIFDWTIKVG
ncbi:hypothetical protein KI387_012669, partial [Taxus chinensis]